MYSPTTVIPSEIENLVTLVMELVDVLASNVYSTIPEMA
jgi:hypothetical protein